MSRVATASSWRSPAAVLCLTILLSAGCGTTGEVGPSDPAYRLMKANGSQISVDDAACQRLLRDNRDVAQLLIVSPDVSVKAFEGLPLSPGSCAKLAMWSLNFDTSSALLALDDNERILAILPVDFRGDWQGRNVRSFSATK